MNEDFTLKARWVDQGIVTELFQTRQANVKCTGVRLGRVGWRCVDRMLTATHRVDDVSAMLVRKEIHKTAVFLE